MTLTAKSKILHLHQHQTTLYTEVEPMSRTYKFEEKLKIKRDLELEETRRFESFLQDVTFFTKKASSTFHKEYKYGKNA